MFNIAAHLSRHWFKWLLLLVALAGLLLGLFVHFRPDNLTHIYFFDVGQGDAMLIKTADNRNILIDGGPTDEVAKLLDDVIPMWHRQLDVVMLTHPHSDHVTGLLKVLERYQVGEFWYTGTEYDSETYRALLAEITQHKIPIRLANQGDNLTLGTAQLRVIFPIVEKPAVADANSTSIVSIFQYKNFSAIFTGDILTADEPQFLSAVPDVDIIKVPHHGSQYSSGANFLSAAKAEIGVIEVGANNSFGHPHPDILARYQAANTAIYRTDQDGTVEIVTDGKHYKVL